MVAVVDSRDIEIRLASSGLKDIEEKLSDNVRLNFSEGVRLFECPDFFLVGWLANRAREKRYGDDTFFNYNLRLEATNVCVANCLFCSTCSLRIRSMIARCASGFVGSFFKR